MSVAYEPVIRFIAQRHKTDCAVATLAMLLGVSYEAALLAIGVKRVLSRGVEVKTVIAAAKRLGRQLNWQRTFDVNNDTGILGVKADKWDYEHLVILKDGIVIDGQDSTIWDYDAYMAAHSAQPMSLMTLELKS